MTGVALILVPSLGMGMRNSLQTSQSIKKPSWQAFMRLNSSMRQQARPLHTRNSLLWNVGRNMVLVVCLAAVDHGKSVLGSSLVKQVNKLCAYQYHFVQVPVASRWPLLHAV